jgi:hypothetical protein
MAMKPRAPYNAHRFFGSLSAGSVQQNFILLLFQPASIMRIFWESRRDKILIVVQERKMKKIITTIIAVLTFVSIVHAEPSMAEKIVTIDAGRE